jgi:uncharacterized protein (TIGR02466 family)
MNIAEIFPTPIFVDNYTEKETIKNLILKEIKKQKPEPHLCSPQLLHYGNTSDGSIFRKKEFKSFKQWCEKSCEKFITEVLGYKLEDGVFVTDSWINVCNKDGFQQPHFHTNSFISGTYYVNFDKDLGHSPLTFQSPSSANYISKSSISLEKIVPTPYTTDSNCYPQNGDLVLWQSHLLHGHFGNEADDRISVSMNFMPKVISTGQYGFRVSPY